MRQNRHIIKINLAFLNFGNASSRYGNYCIIKPSGVDLDQISFRDISIVEIGSRKHVGGLSPSTDHLTHIELYEQFGAINGIAHTHSMHATAWAQARKSIPCLGTTHADYWSGNVPITRELGSREIKDAYELNTGKAIVETINDTGQDPMDYPGVLVVNHGPFTWGSTIEEAIRNAEILEYVAELSTLTLGVNSSAGTVPPCLHDKHFSRKHGSGAYYGQHDI